MELTLNMLLIVCPLVFLAGFIDSIAGGGGLISLPAFLLAGLPPHTAIATNKLSSTIGTTISAARLVRYLDLSLAGLSILCALLGSALGSRLSLLASEALIQYLLLPVLVVVAWHVLRKNKKDIEPEAVPAKPPLPRSRAMLYSMAISLVVGCYDGFYGPGTGTFLLLLYTGLVRLDILTASANTKAVNLSSNLGSLVVFLLNGKVFYALGLPAALFCMAGHYLGSGLVVKNGTRIVRPIILVVLAILFLKILFF
ncbi:MAG: TSUP family transporter [Lachnospiraceae bacterium]|jgi:uncharacterized membrane protein YfcA|nr:TSUP family transporter [Lachnospiraceae bacterium]MCI8995591.1 TSUP family transporter [Lachnospiraceae bacterium]